MKLSRWVSAGALALALAACGGGGGSTTPGGGGTGGGGGGGGTPTPTPPSYIAFADATGDQTYASACTGYQTGFGIGSFPGTSFGNGFGIAFSGANETWTISPARGFVSFGKDFSFGPSDLDSSTAQGTASYRRTDTNGETELFRYGFDSSLNPAPAFARSMQFSAILPNAARGVFRCAFGVPTVLEDDLPEITNSSGFLSYASYSIEGDAFISSGNGTIRQFSLDRTAIDFRADPRNGAISVSMVIIGREFQSDGSLSDQEVALGELQGATSIDGTEQNFSELIDGQSFDRGQFGGSFGGWFFGPQGGEVAFVFDASANLNDGSNLVVAAVVTGIDGQEFVPT